MGPNLIFIVPNYVMMQGIDACLKIKKPNLWDDQVVQNPNFQKTMQLNQFWPNFQFYAQIHEIMIFYAIECELTGLSQLMFMKWYFMC